MIAKVIAYGNKSLHSTMFSFISGNSRQHCIQRMIEAIKRTTIVGLTTNQHFLLQVLREPDFLAGKFNTHFIENHPHLAEEKISNETYFNVSIAGTLFLWFLNKETQFLHRHVTSGFRNVRYRDEYKEFNIDGNDIKVEYRVLPQTFARSQELYRETTDFKITIEGI